MRWFILVSLLLCACGGQTPPRGDATSPLPPPRAPALANDAGATAAETGEPPATTEPPFSAEQLRAACPAGRVISLRVEAKGKRTVVHVIRFVSVDDNGADIETFERDARGAGAGEPDRQRATWEELRRHGAFPRATTTVEDGVADTPAGRFPSRVYVVQGGDEISRYHFSMSRPGPPVLLTTDKGGARIFTSALVPEPIECKSDDDCWIDDGKAVRRPKQHRGKKLVPCRDGERAPVCKAGVCGVRAFKC